MRLKWLAIAFAAALTGCGAVPSNGPSALAIASTNPEGGVPKTYVVVRLDERAVNVAGQYRPPSFSSFFTVQSGVPNLLLAVGDRIQVNIFEAGADGLFSSSTAKATQITSVVDAQGEVFVPYVGPVQAAGRSPSTLRRIIEEALEDKAIQPQVQVLVDESLANSVTVLGSVGAPGNLPISAAGVRVLDLIAAAGGSTTPTWQTRVILRRDGKVASANLEDLFDNPEDNVPIQPGDTVLVTDVARTFTVYGATTAKAEIAFEQRRVTLAEGIAKAGGLDDAVADPRGVFLFRFEPDHIAKTLDERAGVALDGSMVPVVYRLNLEDPESFFIMQTFDLRDEDLIYVANHPSVEFNKFLRIIEPLVQQAITGLTLTQRFGRD
ncbi:polysaccharide biosynthesis/export family protein [Acuticoccus sp.]|uniref:polysaccharide biosynthesis/export family protein n=1 Tax=Acuticoccus sp. TaxID=1904378 RepID=UPI003B52B35B